MVHAQVRVACAIEGHDAHAEQRVFLFGTRQGVFAFVEARLRELIGHHEDRLLAIEEHCAEIPATARELLPVLFSRELDPRQMMMALGEAIAHLHLLLHRNRLERELSEDGCYRYRSIDPDLPRRSHPDSHDAPSDQPVMV